MKGLKKGLERKFSFFFKRKKKFSNEFVVIKNFISFPKMEELIKLNYLKKGIFRFKEIEIQNKK